MTESAKFEVYTKKLQGICDEHNLVFRFRKDKYPVALTIQSAGGLDGQLTMLENVEEEGYRSPDAQLVFAYKDGELVYRISETFTISDALFNKLKNLFKNMHALWLQFFFRDLMERDALTDRQMPVISDDDENDIADEAFDGLKDELEPLELFEDNEDSDGDTDANPDEDNGEETDDYEYDKPGDAADEA